MKYQIKPYEVEAVQYNGGNIRDLKVFCKRNNLDIDRNGCWRHGRKVSNTHVVCYIAKGDYLVLRTDTGKIGVYSEEDFKRKFQEVADDSKRS